MKLNETPVLSLQHMNKQFGDGCDACKDRPEQLERNYCPKCRTVYACRDISFDLYRGEIIGVVGESGSGKSTLMKALYFDQDVTSGRYFLEAFEGGNTNLFEVSVQKKKRVRNLLLGMVYQNPISGLRMDFSSVSNIAEKMIASEQRNVHTMKDRAHELLSKVDIPIFRSVDPPKKFSGGMQQRVQIAKALSNRPPILLLDEVTTGLDLSVQAEVLDLIKMIQRDLKISMLVVSHDLAVIRMLADRTVVMYNGQVIEKGLTDQILEDPQHAFTQQLVYSLL